ncbi:Trehalose/maltose import ATP-binding protein MalK [Candidatus Zixiibacteriota bacterium]|nr:Trehalose/maltose import ATP-binding protein MalK [candidate division Zixibacteria bacterium]
MPTLKISSLSKNFSGKKILDNLNFETSDGELVVVLGPSGCGKSTLLRLISGLEEPDTGEIHIGEKQIDRLPPQKRNVALVFQNYALYPHMTVAQNLAFPLKVAKFDRAEINNRVKQTAELIGLGDRLKSRPAELSGGQRQRVALGRAIIRKPDLFLLDEPLSNLDADLRARMRREIVELQKRLGTTTIYVTHDQVEALTMADRLIVLESGRIRQIGTPEEVYNHPVDTFVASFLGTPKINLIDGIIVDNKIKPFDWPASILPAGFTAEKFIIGIRPEDIIISPEGQYSGTVRSVEYLGDRMIVSIQYEGLVLTASSGAKQLTAQNSIRFGIMSEKLLFFPDRSRAD